MHARPDRTSYPTSLQRTYPGGYNPTNHPKKGEHAHNLMKTVLLLLTVAVLNLIGQNNDRGWYGFASYAGARQMCDQFLKGSGSPMEIHWRSFATPDTFEKVVAFYDRTKVKDVEKESDSVTFHLDQDTVLSVHAALPVHYPTCENKPKSGEKTVIVVSRAARR